jgi:hopanoid biosynthesis associated protein HpnK
MFNPSSRDRRLIVNADDFGRSSSINQAVIQAHQRGILTTASLMVNGAAAAEAVQLARQNPRLGVGLHIALAHGTSALPHSQIPDLTDAQGNFSNDPVAAGFNYFRNRRCHAQLESEIAAQFDRFFKTGLPLDHVNGHLHFHLHPTVFEILSRRAAEFQIRHFRLTRDPFFLNARLAKGRWFYRLSHAIIFTALSRRAARNFRGANIRSPAHVFGLLQNALVDEPYILSLLPELPPGDSELYSHPSLDEFKNEFDALVSPKVRAAVDQLGIKLIRYSDL